ncbi:MAG TPA: MarR family winged helix-turn-helix transcriptional regulator [Gammaproteobacteria bacterium]|nr:MarR family winged helix-turn-helix transcriptional regulator [Gammaproteobacteria bacterium]
MTEPSTAPPGIDLGPLNQQVGYVLRRAQIAVFSDSIAYLNDVDLRPTQFGVLMVIDQNPGLTQSDVCLALGIQKANFVPLLNELEHRGLAVRRKGKADRRAYALYLTAAGRALLGRARALQAKYEKDLTRRLGNRGREQLLALLGRLIEPQRAPGASAAGHQS